MELVGYIGSVSIGKVTSGHPSAELGGANMFTVGFRTKKRVAENLRMEWSSNWLHTRYYDTEEEARKQKEEWQRNKRNDETEFKVIPVREITHTGGGETLSTEYLEED